MISLRHPPFHLSLATLGALAVLLAGPAVAEEGVGSTPAPAAVEAAPSPPTEAADGAAVEVGEAAESPPSVDAHAELAKAQARVTELEQALGVAEQARHDNLGRIAQLNDSIDLARKRAAALQTQLDARDQALSQARAELKEHEEALQAGREAVTRLETAAATTESALVDARAELGVREASLAEVQSLYDACAAKADDAQARIAAAKAETERVKATLIQARASDQARIDELEGAMRELLKKSLIRIRTLPDERVRVRMSSDRVFLPAQAVVSAEGQAMLAQIDDLVAASGLGQIRIEVHEDREPGARSGRSDRELSRARADALAAYLARATGVPAHRFLAAGDGSSHPIASNEDPLSRALNRRVEIYLPPRNRVLAPAAPMYPPMPYAPMPGR